MPSAPRFNVGDIVQLKSGGPRMTVVNTEGVTGSMRCQWFSGAKLNQGFFDPDALVPLDNEAGSK